MDPEEPLDYGDDEYGGGAGTRPRGFPGAIQALADDDDPPPEDDDYDDLYNDVNVGDSFLRSFRPPAPAAPRYPEPEVRADPPPPAPARFPPLPPPAPPRDTPPLAPISIHGPRPPAAPGLVTGPLMVYVGDLHWWTTDADVEGVVSRYGRVKEIRFFEERASGKSKGYCQVDFYDAVSAATAKERVNGHVFNGRACVVDFTAPLVIRQMSNRSQSQQQGRRMMNDGTSRGGGGSGNSSGGGMNYQGRSGNWGRGNQGMHNRSGPRGRGNMGGRNMGGPVVDLFGQPQVLGPAGGILQAPGIMGTGFDPSYMGRGGPYGGFSSPAFPTMMPPFQAMNAVGLPGVAPHVNPAFFGRGGIPPNGMMMLGGGGMDGQPSRMWPDPNMGGWNVDDRDDGASDYDYGELNYERGGRAAAASREKDSAPDRDWSGNTERRHHDEREQQDWDRTDRERYRDDKDGYRDHRQRDRIRDHEEDWQNSLRSGSRPRTTHEEDHRSHTRDADYGKKRRAD